MCGILCMGILIYSHPNIFIYYICVGDACLRKTPILCGILRISTLIYSHTNIKVSYICVYAMHA
jgi:hypothetical protein